MRRGLSSKDSILAQAVQRQDVPFAVGMVANANGVIYSGAAGDAAPGRKAGEDTIFRIFSKSKAVGSTAAMLLIDRAKLDPETPVADILPEFAAIRVLERFDGDTPVLRAPRIKATVRHLATHTSGLEYEFWNADVAKFMEKTRHPSILSGLKSALFYPMLTDPGTRWGYGPGMDWLGLVVEKIDGRRIDVFCREEIFEPLGMSDTVFEVSDQMVERLAAVTLRGGNGTFEPFDLAPPSKPEVYGMGHCLYSSAPDYMKFLRLFLNRGTLNGKRVLSEKAVDWMLADRMGGLAFEKMVTVTPAITADCDPFPGVRRTHGFAFLRNESDIPGRRSAGSHSWAGVLNTHYWFDPNKDIAAVIMTQSLPFAEPRCLQLCADFETAVYAENCRPTHEQ
jgi:CubicO group peptidase (beta-lactamase class C family)